MYLVQDKNKNKARDRYMISEISHGCCSVKKVAGSQFRKFVYKVPLNECIKVPCQSDTTPSTSIQDDSSLSDCEEYPPSTEFTSPSETQPPFLPHIPLDISPADDITDDEPDTHDSSEPKPNIQNESDVSTRPKRVTKLPHHLRNNYVLT